MKPNTHYTPTENGFAISGSAEFFNRTLYGSHKNDDKSDRFFTFAGDVPKFLGATTDWIKNNVTYYDKCGQLHSGLAITPGTRSPFWYSRDIDTTSRWFHDSEDVVAEFKNGWMEYKLSQCSAWFPDVRVNIEAYPLLPDDGYLVHYRITTDQHVYFVAGFGGVAERARCGRFEYKGVPHRDFGVEDAKGNVVELGKNRACITQKEDGRNVRVATSFDADFSLGSAKAMSEPYPSIFLGNAPEHDDDNVVKISAAIKPGQMLDGYILVLYNSDEATLEQYLTMKNPVGYIKQQLYAKHACIDVSTPEKALDLTIAPTVMAMDASWHKDAFYHGSFAYHTPFLGWRNWYAPTALGWGDRVETTMAMWLSHITRGDVKDERVWYYDGESRYFHDGRYHELENPVGRLPAFFTVEENSVLKPYYGPYNMHECALDMMLYYIEWSGNLALAEKYFDDMCAMADFETRIFDPDDDGLYQNQLNTWISDGHNYNGAGCAQSTAYNYRANLVLSKIAKKIGRDGERFALRAEKIKRALNEKLWMPNEGVIAESLDTIGNCLLHPSVELPTVYHVMDSEMIDGFKAYRTLKFTEKHLKSIATPGNGGRLCYSSNWLPKKYSQCGIFPQENAHLALVYFKLGLKDAAKKLLDGIADCYFTGKNPGMAAHVQSAMCTNDLGDMDFSDVSSTYLRLVVEGLFGIRINHLDNLIYIQPGFPDEWEHASLTLGDIAFDYHRRGSHEVFTVHSDRTERKRIRVPMRASDIEAVMLDGVPVPYEIVPAPNNSFITVETDKVGRFQLRVMHGNGAIPTVACPESVVTGGRIAFELKGATLVEVFDVSEALEDITVVGNKVYATAKDAAGDHTLFVRAVNGEYNAWLAADYDIVKEEPKLPPLTDKPFVPVDISAYFNCNMTEVHEKDYLSPRPKGFSMSLYRNGRYSHNAPQARKVKNANGKLVMEIEDSFFRNAGGTVYSPSGIPFATPATGENLACVSIFDVFPTALTVPLEGTGEELAILFIASAFNLHTGVENVRVTVEYADGTKENTSLMYPTAIDDWLTSALTTESEVFYFSNTAHASVKRIRIRPDKPLAGIKIEAIANEVIFGVAGISVK
ncbi:MAG: hypothetical protein E7657_01605 [Ruminococcaceae bacterium]|nr:hypothetical protein [Oscillospiraceae bacterium]